MTDDGPADDRTHPRATEAPGDRTSADRTPTAPRRATRRGLAVLLLIVALVLVAGGTVGALSGNVAQSGIIAPAVVFLVLARRAASRGAGE